MCDSVRALYLLTYLLTYSHEADGNGYNRYRRAEGSIEAAVWSEREPSATAVDRRSTLSARVDRQEPLPMFRCPGFAAGFPLIT